MRHSERSPDSVTIIDVAREAGVSSATVSRVINEKDNVSLDTRDTVLQAMERLGYSVNLQARSLAGGRSNVIGLLVRDLGTGYIGEIVRGIDAEVAAAHYDMMLYTTHRQKMKESGYVATLTRGMADGLLLVLPRNPESYLESLRLRRFPYVLIDHQGLDHGGPAVGATNHRGAYDVTRYLVELGHRRIGFITGSLEIGCAIDRLAGYKACLTELGIPLDPGIIYEGNFFQSEGYAGANFFLSLPHPPTAIFASNDVSAFGVMEAIRERGLRIPEDISVVGFDDIPLANQIHPPLTTVRQPLEQMGRVATRILLKFIANPQIIPERVELPTELVIRKSCLPPSSVQRSA